jgi:hypothetical protein
VAVTKVKENRSYEDDALAETEQVGRPLADAMEDWLHLGLAAVYALLAIAEAIRDVARQEAHPARYGSE